MLRWVVFVLVGWWLVLHALVVRGETRDADLLRGNWVLDSLERDSDPLPFAEKGDRFTLRDGKIKIDTKATTDREWEYRLDDAKEPKQFDLLPVRRNRAKSRFALHGIYKLEGNQLVICIADPAGLLGTSKEKDRPTRFESGPDRTLLTFTRSDN